MEPRTVRLVAPSRLHFGLLPHTGNLENRRGGIGVMVDVPCLQMSAARSTDWKVIGPSSERVQRIIKTLWADSIRMATPLCIRIDQSPPTHSGFGSGTQLSMSVAAILACFHGNDQSSNDDIACKLGRGNRSRVGSKGFEVGGLIFDRGVGDESEFAVTIAPECHVVPEPWRWLTVTCERALGKSGKEEQEAFAKGKPDSSKRMDLLRLIDTELLPGLAAQDFHTFSDALGRYSRKCGEVFAPQQGGLYGSLFAEEAAAHLARAGIAGIGQSSWGPTIFALFPNPDSAANFVKTSRWLHESGIRFSVSPSNTTGAVLSGGPVACS